MDHSLGFIAAEILAGTIFVLWLGRRIILTTIYVCVLIKFGFLALRRRYRHWRVYWRHVRDKTPHGFILKIVEYPFHIMSALIPTQLSQFLSQMIWYPAKIYNRLEYWGLMTAGPWVYARLPKRGQIFSHWITTKVRRLLARSLHKRRMRYAQNSYNRYLARLAKEPKSPGSCPMRVLLPQNTGRTIKIISLF